MNEFENNKRFQNKFTVFTFKCNIFSNLYELFFVILVDLKDPKLACPP